MSHSSVINLVSPEPRGSPRHRPPSFWIDLVSPQAMVSPQATASPVPVPSPHREVNPPVPVPARRGPRLPRRASPSLSPSAPAASPYRATSPVPVPSPHREANPPVPVPARRGPRLPRRASRSHDGVQVVERSRESRRDAVQRLRIKRAEAKVRELYVYEAACAARDGSASEGVNPEYIAARIQDAESIFLAPKAFALVRWYPKAVVDLVCSARDGSAKPVMLKVLSEARRRGHARVYLHPVKGVDGYYRRFGFASTSPYEMVKNLSNSSNWS